MFRAIREVIDKTAAARQIADEIEASAEKIHDVTVMLHEIQSAIHEQMNRATLQLLSCSPPQTQPQPQAEAITQPSYWEYEKILGSLTPDPQYMKEGSEDFFAVLEVVHGQDNSVVLERLLAFKQSDWACLRAATQGEVVPGDAETDCGYCAAMMLDKCV
jgi:hypothetical protein